MFILPRDLENVRICRKHSKNRGNQRLAEILLYTWQLHMASVSSQGRGCDDGWGGRGPSTKLGHLLLGCGERANCRVWSVSDPENAEVRHGALPFPKHPEEGSPMGLNRKVQVQQFLH